MMLEKMCTKSNLEVEIKKVNIDDSIRILREKFLEIKRKGYIKSIRGGSTGVGATFEALLGKNEDKLQLPDFRGIEIKTKRGYSKSLINLFSASPLGETNFEVKRIRDKYGYPDINDKSLKRFCAKIGADELVRVGLFYRFKLKVDRKKKRVVLCVYDWNEVCIDESSYWDFDVLKEKLYRKLSVLALVKAWPNKIAGVEYFKYYKLNVYILRNFGSFLQALEDGVVKVSFRVGNHYDSMRYGDVHAHGVSFAMSEEDLDKIFDIYR